MEGQVLMSRILWYPEVWAWNRTARVQSSALFLRGATTLSELPNVSMPHIPHMENGDVVGLSELLCVKS